MWWKLLCTKEHRETRKSWGSPIKPCFGCSQAHHRNHQPIKGSFPQSRVAQQPTKTGRSPNCGLRGRGIPSDFSGLSQENLFPRVPVWHHHESSLEPLLYQGTSAPSNMGFTMKSKARSFWDCAALTMEEKRKGKDLDKLGRNMYGENRGIMWTKKPKCIDICLVDTLLWVCSACNQCSLPDLVKSLSNAFPGWGFFFLRPRWNWLLETRWVPGSCWGDLRSGNPWEWVPRACTWLLFSVYVLVRWPVPATRVRPWPPENGETDILGPATRYKEYLSPAAGSSTLQTQLYQQQASILLRKTGDFCSSHGVAPSLLFWIHYAIEQKSV